MSLDYYVYLNVPNDKALIHITPLRNIAHVF